jgi:hypothetical protein
MSHLSKIQCNIDDLDSLKKALEEMGYGYIEGRKTLSAYSWSMEVDLQLTKDSKPLLIGFKKEKDGTYSAQADWYCTGINSRKFNEDLNMLHAKHKVLDKAKSNGFFLESCENMTRDGKRVIELTFRSWDSGDDNAFNSSFNPTF